MLESCNCALPPARFPMKTDDGMLRVWLRYVLAPWAPLALVIAYLLGDLRIASLSLWLLVLGPPLCVAALFWMIVVVVSGTSDPRL
jgi:hypothetical protein